MAQPNKHQVPDRVLWLLVVEIAEVYKSNRLDTKKSGLRNCLSSEDKGL